MIRLSTDLLIPRILIVDDERQIHASLRLRLGSTYDLAFCFSARDALKLLASERFDLCFADIHMPNMDGLAFIAAAGEIDPHLGFVVLAHSTRMRISAAPSPCKFTNSSASLCRSATGSRPGFPTGSRVPAGGDTTTPWPNTPVSFPRISTPHAWNAMSNWWHRKARATPYFKPPVS
jgi:hypothetical protein